MWSPKPNSLGVNHDGFVGPIVPLARTAGVFRIACLGDSCTHWGDPPYPERLAKLLTKEGVKVETLNAGVVGHSSWQGLQRLRERVAPYRPDVVTVYYGWNDHWQWRTRPDSDPTTDGIPWTQRTLDSLSWSRVVQGVRMCADLLGQIRKPAPPTLSFRVPLLQFRENLHAIIREIRAIPAEPILITAPTDMTPATIPTEFFQLTQLDRTPYATPNELHDAYVQIVRQVATEQGVLLCDVEKAFAGDPKLFCGDHIHFNDAGYDRAAAVIRDAVVQTQAWRKAVGGRK
jgi:lysophospholipase L1-like esterase